MVLRQQIGFGRSEIEFEIVGAQKVAAEQPGDLGTVGQFVHRLDDHEVHAIGIEIAERQRAMRHDICRPAANTHQLYA